MGENAQRVSELNFVSGAGLGALEAIENGGRQDVAPGDGEIGRGGIWFRFFDEILYAHEARAKRRLRGGFAGDDAIEMGFVARDFLDGDGADAGGFVNLDELFCGGIRAGN